MQGAPPKRELARGLTDRKICLAVTAGVLAAVLVFALQRAVEESSAATILAAQNDPTPLSDDPVEREDQIQQQLTALRKQTAELTGEITAAERERNAANEQLNVVLSQVQQAQQAQQQQQQQQGSGLGADGDSVVAANSPDQSVFKEIKPGPAGSVLSARTNPPMIPNVENVDPAFAALLQQRAVEKEVLVTIAVSELHSLLEVWLKQVLRAAVSNALVLCMDANIHEFCNAHSEGGKVGCYRVHAVPLPTSPPLGSAAAGPDRWIAMAIDSLNGAKFYLLRDALALGYSVLVADVDVAVLRNPFLTGELVRDCDVEAMTVGHDHATAYGYNDVTDDASMGWARYAHTMRVFAMDVGFFLARPTAPALELFDRVAARLGEGNAGNGPVVSGLVNPLVVFNEEMFYPSRPGYTGVFLSRRVMDMHRFINSKMLFKELRRDVGRLQTLVGSVVAVRINYHADKLSRLGAVISFFVDRQRSALDAIPLASS